MKKKLVGLISLLALIAAYLVFRFPLFELHGMKDFPMYLLVAGVIVIVISGFIRENKVLPILTVVGYIVGFICGNAFGYSYGEGLHNMWIIWMWCFVVAVGVGIFINLFMQRKTKVERV